MSGHAPAIGSYGLIGDCHSAALISDGGSIDWCCLPRFDSPSCFGRLIDDERGGFCDVTLDGGVERQSSAYVPDTMLLKTTLEGQTGTVTVTDFFAMREDGALAPRREIVRIIECERGNAVVVARVAPRFDYGAVQPWLRRTTARTFTAIGADNGLLIWSDGELDATADMLTSRAELNAGERLRLLIRFARPHEIDGERAALETAEVDGRLEETLSWWQTWREHLSSDGPDQQAVVRSALTLKALTYAPTGAYVAAPTTSLPETMGGERNWDYRYSWVRDSALSAGALADLGCESESRQFRSFITRSSAGNARSLRPLFGVEGERRMPEQELDLRGYGGSQPVRIGNGADDQLQLDTYGEVLDLAWRWHRRGDSPDDHEWKFLAEVVDCAVEQWSQPDRGIWEWRGEPRHFVHSKACCWTAVERGLQLAQECARRAPTRRWRHARTEIREAIEAQGYDKERGIFVQTFGEPQLDAALLLLPLMGFVDHTDERMVRTTDAIREELDANGFLYRYRQDDDLPGEEGAFLPCSFWLAECYAEQGRLPQARKVFDRAMGAAGPLGLFSEQIDPVSEQLLGNYPQTLTHLSHMTAMVALNENTTGISERPR